jgi:hypothetical protein
LYILVTNAIPEYLKEEVYEKALYRNFLRKFKRYFDFPKKANELTHKGRKIKVEHASWKFHIHFNYRGLLMDIMTNLEPIEIERDTNIHDENTEVDEVLFIKTGIISIGYRINKEPYMVLNLGSEQYGHIVGDFYVTF